ncbi:hypothetical protein ONZ45_g7513 [Pleurotus djamor]|nr:hypothetical protein ONZ45_g7513 [Pleurotus djamor]
MEDAAPHPIPVSLHDPSPSPSLSQSDISDIFTVTTDDLEAIRACIRDVLLPTWIERPPSNLGEASHGKLKAHELLILFSTILPLIVPELWSIRAEDEQYMALLTSFCYLIYSTHIISSYTVSATDADAYTQAFTLYRRSIQLLFPHFKSVPNHHYAMHNGALLKFWGPLSLLSEFPGERLNGDFGKINTNHNMGEKANSKHIFKIMSPMTK